MMLCSTSFLSFPYLRLDSLTISSLFEIARSGIGKVVALNGRDVTPSIINLR
jgi:hypothetical protein